MVTSRFKSYLSNPYATINCFILFQVGEIAERAPKVIEDNVPFVEGVAKTIQETSGFVGGVLVPVAANTTSTVVEFANNVLVPVAANATSTVMDLANNVLNPTGSDST